MMAWHTTNLRFKGLVYEGSGLQNGGDLEKKAQWKLGSVEIRADRSKVAGGNADATQVSRNESPILKILNCGQKCILG
jgi:uncharacterized metal-binding protein